MQLIYLSLNFNILTSWARVTPQEANNVAHYRIMDIYYIYNTQY